ncbi:MAG: hypothetical protein AB1546_04635 [bacterium]
MKLIPKVENWKVLKEIPATLCSDRTYEAIGLQRGWDDIIVNILNRRFEKERERLEKEVAELLAEAKKAEKPAA